MKESYFVIHFPTSGNSISSLANFTYGTIMIQGHPLSYCNRFALSIVSLSTSSMYCVCGQNATAAPNNHGLAFTSLRTATVNTVTPGRLHTVESAVQSVWDTLRFNILSDTATSESVWASDETETTTKLCIHSRIITSFNLYAIDMDQI